MEITDVDYAPPPDRFDGPPDLIRICYNCGGGDVHWCNISVRPYCAECRKFGAMNLGPASVAVARWNQLVKQSLKG